MKIFANENLFEPIIYLRSLGNDVLSIRDSGLSGISDDEVFERACKENMVIITMDKDFTRIFRFPPEKCGGIVVAKMYVRRTGRGQTPKLTFQDEKTGTSSGEQRAGK